jgi:hypothetical protein
MQLRPGIEEEFISW